MVRWPVSSDVVLAVAISLANLLNIIFYPADPLHPILGATVALAIPGYLATLLLFPSRLSLDRLGRAILSFTITLGLVVASAVVFTALNIPFNAAWVSGVLLAIIVGLAGAAEVRRWRLPPNERFHPSLPRIQFPRSTVPERIIAVGIAALLIIAGVILYTVAVRPPAGDYTTLYLLNSQGMASNYPLNVTVGSINGMIVGVASHENRTVDFSLELAFLNASDGGVTTFVYRSNLSDGIRYFKSGGAIVVNFTLDPGKVWEQPMSFQVTSPGTFSLQFFLLRDRTTIYRQAFLWINATA